VTRLDPVELRCPSSTRTGEFVGCLSGGSIVAQVSDQIEGEQVNEQAGVSSPTVLMGQ
jgi:hypothetical protein